MAESGLAGRFCFSASAHTKNCRNVTFKHRLGTTPQTYGKKADFSKFRPFGCRAYLKKERRASGKLTPRAVEAIHLGFVSDCNMSSSRYKFYVPSTGQHMYSNQAKCDEDLYPYQNQDMIEGMPADESVMTIMLKNCLRCRRMSHGSSLRTG